MTVGEMLEKAEKYLASRGVSEARANAELIVAHVLACKRPQARADSARVLKAKQEHQAWHLTLERGRRTPLAYVLGSQEFMGLEIRVTPSVLIPRPETEELVQATAEVARRTAGGRALIVDIGTGSGCVAIALARLLPDAQLVATEISPAALALAEENARKHQLGHRIRFINSDLFHPAQRGLAQAGCPKGLSGASPGCPKGLSGASSGCPKGLSGASSGWADVAVSNPPYIPSKEVPKLEPEVLKEPHLALDGGPDGLDAIRAIVDEAPRTLRPGGWLLLEIGHGQEEAVRKLLAAKGFQDVSVKADAQGVPRIALAMRPLKESAVGLLRRP